MRVLDLLLQTVVLHQPDVEGRRPSLPPLQHQPHRLARLGYEAVGLDGCVQRLLRHGSVGCPLPTWKQSVSPVRASAKTPRRARGQEVSWPAMVTSPLSLMLTMWFLQMDWVSLELGSVTRGRMPLHAASTSPRRTADSKTPDLQSCFVTF